MNAVRYVLEFDGSIQKYIGLRGCLLYIRINMERRKQNQCEKSAPLPIVLSEKVDSNNFVRVWHVVVEKQEKATKLRGKW